MKHFAFVILSMILSLSVSHAEQTVMPLHDEPRPVPSIEFNDGAGRGYALEDWRGRVVLLNIWATWCPPCRHEMPTLDGLQAKLGSERFQVIALSIDRAGVGPVEDFFSKTNIQHLEIYIDETGRSASKLGAFGLPATLLIGPDGRELGRLVGPAEWDTPTMIEFLKNIVANTTEGHEE